MGTKSPKLGVFQREMQSGGWAAVTAERRAGEVNEICPVTKQYRDQMPALCSKGWETKHFERALVSQPIGKCKHVCHSNCNFGPHMLRFSVPKVVHEHQEAFVMQAER